MKKKIAVPNSKTKAREYKNIPSALIEKNSQSFNNPVE